MNIEHKTVVGVAIKLTFVGDVVGESVGPFVMKRKPT